jgi:hypothetical protein
VSKDKRLKLLAPKDQKLGRPTIMDRALAQRHGTPYVHAAVFAIDVDRLREHEEERGELPFAWEVHLTECYVTRFLAGDAHVPLLEDMCLHILELPRPSGGEAGALGNQLPFAVYAGVVHGSLPPALGDCFRVWKKPPTDLLEELAKLRADHELLAKLVDFALDADLTPPLAPPVREALLKLPEGPSP